MKNKYLIGFFCICILLSAVGCSSDVENKAESEDNIVTTVASSEYSQEEFTEERDSYENLIVEEYSNPIDSYFLPNIANAECEADRKELQCIYMCVWSKEFDDVMLWMQDKCIYQEDKDNLLLYAESVKSLGDITYTVLQTDWADTYKQAPGDKGSGGTGTHYRLNQMKGEVYRDASMKLIDDTYVFIEQDYSLAVYE